MNVAYNAALRQSRAIQHDLENLGGVDTPTAAAIGNVSASLSSFSKTIDEYNSIAKQELIPKKQEEAFERIKNFRQELSDFRTRVDDLRSQREDAVHQMNRGELLGRRPYVTSTPENPYAEASLRTATSSMMHARQPPAAGAAGGPSFGSGDAAREAHALREQSFFASTNSALDDYIARGQAVLGDLGEQREMLKNTQRRLYSVANTLGVSGDTIRMIERRAREDKWIFWAGVVVFFVFCWLCLHYLR